jgi:O-acetyl-ADP-ribose deacetylase
MTFLEINRRRLELVEGDITRQEVDVVVNAANSQLAGGGGVDGAIHRIGGPEIMAETRRRYAEGCPTGSAVITNAGNLPARYVIHAVGPVWSGGHRGERELLESAYRECLRMTNEYQCTSIAFPALSAGAYRFPIDEASRIAVTTTIAFLSKLTSKDSLEFARFALFSPEAFAAFCRAIHSLHR